MTRELSPIREKSEASTGSKSSSPKLPENIFVHNKGIAAQVLEQGHPLGFSSNQEFRDLTRLIAQANREGDVIVSGSSVTGFSAKKGTPFDKNPAKPRSDIDVGVIHDIHFQNWDKISDERGFPIGKMSHVERAYGSNIKKALGRPSGIKFFDNFQIEQDGRSYMIRPHTPPPSRSPSPTPSARRSESTTAMPGSEKVASTSSGSTISHGRKK